MNIHLVVIDPQNDFMDIQGAKLPVPGANEDMNRLAKMVERVGKKLADIHVTLDSHRLLDIAHPAWWRNQKGDQPAPFTIITQDDVENGIWTPRIPAFRDRCLQYVRALATQGNYQLQIWPPHCLIGTWGHNVHCGLNDALQEWSDKELAMVDYLTKGSNPWTEHYGAMMAEVPDPEDPGTMLNTDFIEILRTADMIAFGGEALSHCFKTTISQTVNNIGDEHLKKFWLLKDCSSPVPAVPNGPDFPAISEAWLKEMTTRGINLTTSTEFLA